MTIKIWKQLNKNGFIMAGYTFCRSLGITNAVVLAQLLAEYNFANNKNLDCCNFFLCNICRTADYLGLSNEELSNALTELRKLNLIGIYESSLNDYYLIYVNEEEIIQFENIENRQNNYAKWDLGLVNTQAPDGKINSLNATTKKLKFEVEQVYKLPFIVYSVCNYLFEQYSEINFWQMTNINTELQDLLESGYFTGEELVSFIYNKLRET
ncbi:hypothetical protein HDR58_00650 [bacterium]|nr:hypothetical protein [bacterium]